MTATTLQEPGPVERARWAATDALTVAGRDVAHWRRRPGAVLVGALFPVLLLLMFAYLLGGGMVVPGGGDYRDFLVPGMFVLAMVFGVEATMTAVVTDTARGITDRFRSLPMAPSAVVAGRCLADMASSVLGLTVLVAAALAVGWRPAGPGSALAAVGLLLLLRLAFLWIGIYLGLLVRDPSGVMAVQILVWPFAFLSNVFVAASALPGWLATLAEWNPVAGTVTAVRELLGSPTGDGGGWATEHATLLAVAWPVVLTVVFAALSVRRFQRLSA
ncbi:ABC transporter permease [Blastococcus tunisiensis]|uniref:Transport permease protein n=1 Tax=Blastococcus tunisiensis TaxID=1798228 RepID=A0A1I2KZE0_9ACTN|nr:ABC transporter permease [Blastococcus sp. DSM 46838]SFF70547.1 ABC-type multidrug transport system, permease component [Blastococcus sp. DSM 46838]